LDRHPFFVSIILTANALADGNTAGGGHERDAGDRVIRGMVLETVGGLG